MKNRTAIILTEVTARVGDQPGQYGTTVYGQKEVSVPASRIAYTEPAEPYNDRDIAKSQITLRTPEARIRVTESVREVNAKLNGESE